jgi:hypothetical protein
MLRARASQFEISRPVDYRPLKTIPLSFSHFTHSPLQGLFTLPERVSQMAFYLDSSQSFETFLLAVRLRSTYAEPDWQKRRGARELEREVAEGLERVWKSWFEELHDDSRSRTSEIDASGRRSCRRSLSPGSSTGIARVGLQISSESKEPEEPTINHSWPETDYSAVTKYEVSWTEVRLDVARVVVKSEDAAIRREHRAVFTFATPYGGPRGGMIRVV